MTAYHVTSMTSLKSFYSLSLIVANSFRVLFDKIASVYFWSDLLIFQHCKWPAQETGSVQVVSAYFQSLLPLHQAVPSVH